jgi:hypothetical protein
LEDLTVGDLRDGRRDHAPAAADEPQRAAYVDIVSYLSRRTRSAGRTELPIDVNQLMQLHITPKPRR